MFRGFASRVVFVLASLVVAGAACAGEVVRVEGNIVKWPAPTSGGAAEISYAILTGAFSLPSGKSTLSPDNCGAMRAFAEILSTSPGLTEDWARQELRSAFSAWERVAGVKFTETHELDQANIIIGSTVGSIGRAFANLSLGGRQNVASVAKALGAATDRRVPSAADPAKDRPVLAIEQAYICANPTMTWKTGFDGNLDVYDLRYTFMHEIGHAIGLDHPGSSGSIMGYRYDERVRELQASDIEAAQTLYGPPKQR